MITTPTLRESLKRLYGKWTLTGEGSVNDESLLKMLNAEPPKLDAEDFLYITGKPAPQ